MRRTDYCDLMSLPSGTIIILKTSEDKEVECDVEFLMDEGYLLRRTDIGMVFYASFSQLIKENARIKEK